MDGFYRAETTRPQVHSFQRMAEGIASNRVIITSQMICLVSCKIALVSQGFMHGYAIGL
jgi:hypothetical protein